MNFYIINICDSNLLLHKQLHNQISLKANYETIILSKQRIRANEIQIL